jgi:hypothetical protein
MNSSQWADWLKTKADNSPDGAFYVYCQDALRIAAELRISGVVLHAITEGGYDLSTCVLCSKAVVCLPDGLPLCRTCAEKEARES